jgi:membrane-bound lytic murein transglycosylase B
MIRKTAVTLTFNLSIIVAGLLAFALQAQAQSAEGYLSHPEATKFIDEIASENRFPEQKLRELLASAEKKQSILDAIARPAEKTKTWAEYRPIFLTQDRIDKGAAFYQQHKQTFIQAEQQYDVSRFIILAIIGVETRYGHHKGNYRVIDSLATLAFDYPPRSTFFRSELKHFLELEKEAGIDLMQAKGSYAGAMGFGQFISSSYRHYAVDFDNDGQRDLINNPVDAIGSVANYFKRHGWQDHKPVASVARFMKSPDQQKQLDNIVNTGLKPKLTILDIKQAGLMADANYPANEKATAMRFAGEQGAEYWIGLQNFYVITRYNHSPLYAMAVFQLSEELKQHLAL